MVKIIVAILILVSLLGFLFWRFGLMRATSPQGPVNITYWGLWEDENLIKPIIAEFEIKYPNIKVTYNKQSSINYRTRVQTQIRNGSGPDVFRIHNSWLPMFSGDLAPAPTEIFSLNDYKQIFYPVSQESFVKDGKIYAAPVEIDGLALFYNEEILQGVGVEVPKNWRQFSDGAIKMTVRDQGGQIKTAGAALGTTSNVDHWSDILGLMLLQQSGVNFSLPASTATSDVLKFYTGFVIDPQKKSWDVNMPNSTSAFAQGRLAFYFAPSWRAHELRQINPNLKFKVAPVPQLPLNPLVAWATFWGEVVSVKSKHPKEAWQFVKFLTSPEAQKLAYSEASKVRLFGEPYSRVDLASELVNDPLVGAFVTQGPYYKFWYLSSNTFDNGLNDEMILVWQEAVNATLAGQNSQGVLQNITPKIKVVLDKYTKPAPSGK